MSSRCASNACSLCLTRSHLFEDQFIETRADVQQKNNQATESQQCVMVQVDSRALIRIVSWRRFTSALGPETVILSPADRETSSSIEQPPKCYSIVVEYSGCCLFL